MKNGCLWWGCAEWCGDGDCIKFPTPSGRYWEWERQSCRDVGRSYAFLNWECKIDWNMIAEYFTHE